MNEWTQLGVAGATLIILFFIVKNFISEMKENRKDSKELTAKFIDLIERNIKIHGELKQTIEANTKATKESIDSSKLSSDHLTELVLKLATK